MARSGYVIGAIVIIFISSLRASLYAQNVGIGSVAFTPLNMLDIKGNAVIGSGYAGVNNATANGLLVEGKVGIGNTSPSEQLHVTGNVRFSGSLMPNNLPGSAGQVLTSQGAGVAPTWTNTSVSGATAVYTVSQTSSLAMTGTSTSFTLIPGLTYNLILASAANVMIVSQGMVSSSSYGSIVDVAILINGSAPTAGGLQRVCVTEYSQDLTFLVSQLMESWHLNVVEALAAGSYTITVQARSGFNSATRNYASTVGSSNLTYSSVQTTTADASTRKQGVLHIIVF